MKNNSSQNLFQNKPLYPNEIPSQGEQENREKFEIDEPKNVNQNSNLLLPLLLQALNSDGKNFDISSLLPLLGGNSNEAKLFQTLATSLNKTKKKEASVKTEAINNKPFPRDEFIS